MRVLLSCYACSPVHGSEPGVGWHWLKEIARRGHDVTLITHPRNKADIENHRAELGDKVEVAYVPLGRDDGIPSSQLKRYLHYYIWQVLILFYSLRKSKSTRFDLIHHLTYGGVRTGSLLWLLPGRFVFGPIGGGEGCPLGLVKAMGARPLLAEVMRNISTHLIAWSPVFLAMQIRATKILVKTPETRDLLLKKFRSKASVSLEIGSSRAASPQRTLQSRGDKLQILYAGRLLYWKGARILAEAAGLVSSPKPLHVVFAGDGPDREHIKDILSSQPGFTWEMLGNIPRERLFDLYGESQIFAFPSLHDSSANVVLEAMSVGTPTVCLDLGGPPIVMGAGGVAVPARARPYEDVVKEFAGVLTRLFTEPSSWKTLSDQALERAASLTWENAVAAAYADLEARAK